MVNLNNALLRARGSLYREGNGSRSSRTLDSNFLGRIVKCWSPSDFATDFIAIENFGSLSAFIVQILSKEDELLLPPCLSFAFPERNFKLYIDTAIVLDDFDYPALCIYGYLRVEVILLNYPKVFIPLENSKWKDIVWFFPGKDVGINLPRPETIKEVFCSFDDLFEYMGFRVTLNEKLNNKCIVLTLPELFLFLYALETGQSSEIRDLTTKSGTIKVSEDLRHVSATLIRKSTELRKRRIMKSWAD